MAVKAVIEKIEDVAEPLREHYKEQTGPKGVKEFVLELDGPADALPAVKAVKTEAAGYRTKATTAEAKLVTLAPFAAMGDPVEVQAKLDRFGELELAAGGRLDDKAIDKIVDTRLASKLAPVARERDAFKATADTLKAENENFKSRDKNRMITDQVRSAALKEKMLPEAVDDAIMLAERIMEVSDEGVVSVKDKVGFTPGLDVTSWLSDMKPKRAHWWPASSGSGARGNNGGIGGGVNPWAGETWNMTEQGQIYKADQKKAESLATAAGTTIGGKRPAVKK